MARSLRASHTPGDIAGGRTGEIADYGAVLTGYRTARKSSAVKPVPDKAYKASAELVPKCAATAPSTSKSGESHLLTSSCVLYSNCATASSASSMSDGGYGVGSTGVSTCTSAVTVAHGSV